MDVCDASAVDADEVAEGEADDEAELDGSVVEDSPADVVLSDIT